MEEELKKKEKPRWSVAMALLGCHPQLQSGVLVVSGAAPRRPPRGLIPGEEAALCPMLTTSSHLIIDPGLCNVCLWTALGWGLFDGQRYKSVYYDFWGALVLNRNHLSPM